MEEHELLSTSLLTFEGTWRNLVTTRYVALAGYIVLLWDSILMLPRERRYIWSAPSSPLKWIYLLKKYVAILFLTLATITELSGMGGVIKSTMFCKAWLPLAIALGILSIAVGDGLVLKRVCILWENRRLVYNILFIVWASVTTTALCVAIFAISRFAPEVVFDRDFDTCVPTSRIQLVAPAWGIPLIFDITVLIMTCWNALDRPRQLSTRLTTSLSKDGIFYFLIHCSLRILNSILFWKAPSSLILAGAYCSWALAVTVTSRLVINFRVVDLQKGSDTSMPHGRISPFDRSSSQTSSLDKIKIHREEEYELM